MKWRAGTALILVFIMLTSLIGCAGSDETKRDKYVIVTKSAGNPYFDRLVEGFETVIENAGQQCIVKQPEEATAEAQMLMIEEAISEDIQALAVAATDADALEPMLMQAQEKGIKVITFDSNANENCRMTFVNQASTEAVGKALMEAVYDISGGEGQWAILSTTSQAVNQNEWIDAMKKEAEDKKYQDLRLVDIVYGQDEYTSSTNCTRELLDEYPDLKVICAPTVMGIRAACQIVSQDYAGSAVKVTGLGLPSEMVEYIGAGSQNPCPYMYLWNPVETGELTAYTAMELVAGNVTGTIGESFTAGDMGVYEFQKCESGGSEVIVGEPLEINSRNIDEWKELF
ncbi:MAG: substrate-binding domain-containing protein [Lachnospiraceae bacterium]